VLHPSDELGELAWPIRLAYPMNEDASHVFLGERLLVPTSENVDVDATGNERLRELAHVTSQAALDEGRILPGEDEDTHGRTGG
jgi:hypothetical protein